MRGDAGERGCSPAQTRPPNRLQSPGFASNPSSPLTRQTEQNEASYTPPRNTSCFPDLRQQLGFTLKTTRGECPLPAPLLPDPVQLVGDSRGGGHPAGGDPQPRGRAPVAGGQPARRSAPGARVDSGRSLAAGGRVRALSPGPSRAPRPSGEASQGCQTPRGTGALSAQGPRTTALSPPGIRWGRISANPASAEGRGSGERPGRRRGLPGGSRPRTPRPDGGEGWGGVGCEGHSQGPPPTAERKLTTPGLPQRLPETVSLCSKIEKELSIRVIVWKGAEREEQSTNLSEQKGPLPSLA